MWCNCGGPVSPGALDDVDAELNEITCQPDGTWQRTWTTSVNYSCSYG